MDPLLSRIIFSVQPIRLRPGKTTPPGLPRRDGLLQDRVPGPICSIQLCRACSHGGRYLVWQASTIASKSEGEEPANTDPFREPVRPIPTAERREANGSTLSALSRTSAARCLRTLSLSGNHSASTPLPQPLLLLHILSVLLLLLRTIIIMFRNQ